MAEQKEEQGGSLIVPILTGGLMVLGGLVAISLVVSLLKPLLIIGVLGGAGYIGYKLLGKRNALEGEAERKSLSPDADFERRMAELDAIERKLDAEIRKG